MTSRPRRCHSRKMSYSPAVWKGPGRRDPGNGDAHPIRRAAGVELRFKGFSQPLDGASSAWQRNDAGLHTGFIGRCCGKAGERYRSHCKQMQTHNSGTSCSSFDVHSVLSSLDPAESFTENGCRFRSSEAPGLLRTKGPRFPSLPGFQIASGCLMAADLQT